MYTNSAIDLEEKAKREAEEERRRLAREEAKFKEHMEKRKLAMVDAILAEEGGTPLLDSSASCKAVESCVILTLFFFFFLICSEQKVVLCLEHLDEGSAGEGATWSGRLGHEQPRFLQGPGDRSEETPQPTAYGAVVGLGA